MFKKFFTQNNDFEKPIVAVDIGCRWGFADKFLNSDKKIEIYGFDPDEQECKRLRDMYNKDNIHLVPVGLYSEECKKTLFVTKEPACSSIYQPINKLIDLNPALECAREENQIEVQLTTLDKWANEHSIEFIDYLKIDTQGAEFAILNGATNILKTVRYIEIEVEFNPIYAGQPLFSDIDLFLRKFGFELWSLPNIVHYGQNNESGNILGSNHINYDHHHYKVEKRGGQIFWADAVYVKSEIIHGNYSDYNLELMRRELAIANILELTDLGQRIQNNMNKIKAK